MVTELILESVLRIQSVMYARCAMAYCVSRQMKHMLCYRPSALTYQCSKYFNHSYNKKEREKMKMRMKGNQNTRKDARGREMSVKLAEDILQKMNRRFDRHSVFSPYSSSIIRLNKNVSHMQDRILANNPAATSLVDLIDQDVGISASDLETRLRRQFSDVDLDFLLDAADLFLETKHPEAPYISSLFDNVVETFDNRPLTAQQITRLMFYVFVHGSAPGMLHLKVEDFVLQYLDSFHINDLSIICLGFFRGNQRIKSFELLDAMGQRLIRDIGKLDLTLLSNFMKSFRHSDFSRVSFYEKLADVMVERRVIPSLMSLNSVMHIAMAYACTHMYHHQLLSDMFNHFESLMIRGAPQLSRSKDIAKFVWAMGTLMFQSERKETYVSMIDRYRQCAQQGRNKAHPESLADLLQGLAYLGLFPSDLIQKLFRSEVVVRLRDDAQTGKVFQLLLLHASIQIETDQQKAPLLSEELAQSLWKQPTSHGNTTFELETRTGLADIVLTLQEMLGSNKVHCHFILPHFTTADIELRLSRSGQFLDFEQKPWSAVYSSAGPNQCHLSLDLFNALTGTNNNETKEEAVPIAVEVAGPNQCVANHPRLLGTYHTKLRQLRKLGYKVLLIMPEEARAFREMSTTEKKTHLCKRFSEELNVNLVSS